MNKSTFLLSLAFFISMSGAMAATKQVNHPQKSPRNQVVHQTRPIITNFTFKGNHIGDPMEEVLRRSIKVDPGTSSFLRNTEETITKCLESIPATGEGNCLDYNSDLNIINDFEAPLYIEYLFYDRKFYGFRVVFPYIQYPNLKALLISKYGKPHAEAYKYVQNGMGAKIRQANSFWNTHHGSMILMAPYPDTENGWLELTDKAIEAKIEAQQKKSIQDKAKTAL
jgi:hypothetical protein